MVFAVSLSLACFGEAHANDTYDPVTGQLSIQLLQIGSQVPILTAVVPAGAMEFNDVVVQVGTIVRPPITQAADYLLDSYSPLNNQLNVSAVGVNGIEYWEGIVTVQVLVSIGSAVGIDNYDAVTGELTLSRVKVVGGAVYTNVVITVSGVVSSGGGMPRDIIDVYDPGNHQLTMQAVQVGNSIYTNPVITIGKIVSVGHQLPVETQLYLFGTAGSTDGTNPNAGLILGTDGNLYGTTANGGQYDVGTVFRLTPEGTESILYEFGAAGSRDGAQPSGPLIQDRAGNLYGTTAAGGVNGGGTIFRIAPGGTESLIYSFGASATPNGGLVLDGAGNFYGTTSYGGINYNGTVFMVSPLGVESELHLFTGNADGGSPAAGLTAGNDGSYYGTTSAGANGVGTVFKITPVVSAGTAPRATFTTLHVFGNAGVADGAMPLAPLLLASDGNFYGTTNQGGEYNQGAVFEITPTGVESVVYSFWGVGYGIIDAGSPSSGLIQGSDGNLYGTTVNCGLYNRGSIYRITPRGQGTVLNEQMLYSFTGTLGTLGVLGGGISGSLDGAGAMGALVETTDGSFYGTTIVGGIADGNNNGNGMVFKLSDVLTAH